MKRIVTTVLKGMGMGAADAVPGVSGGTIALIVGIYEELIETIKRFGPKAIGVWKDRGTQALIGYLNLRFLIPLVLGIGISLVTIAHLVTWLMASHELLLNAFFFGLVLASAWVVMRQVGHWRWRYLLPVLLGLLVAAYLPQLLPDMSQAGNAMLFVAGAIAISAMLLPGVSGSFLLLVMGLYGTVMSGIKSFDIGLIAIFGAGCVVGLFTFSRVLSWLLRHHHALTLMAIVGFILGSLPQLWPWRQMSSYRMDAAGHPVALAYRYLMPADYTAVTGQPSHWLAATALIIVGVVVVMCLGERKGHSAD
ncbi:DUF368 domain-containing protein [Salinicola rhizosphaerae]|uniref:DUF368 domain-containing protein n=1 Tax=Salinicola rhizosphaerae TaxID=1443141 RepID=A0ABQ3E767_9GAMM|nr:DUF368 domain-containing protein [Salinicola rhizosphaerae]GHB25463.1 DUF368 domain-containing protein [Salinicola rhizosphaerae]